MGQILATYHLTCPASEVDKLSRDICLEQTVEVPERLIAGTTIEREVVATVREIVPLPFPETFAATIAYPAHLCNDQLPQLLNLLYGNISIKNNIRLVDLVLPPALLARFPGPTYGVAGVRSLLGVHGRPLLATALKPRGSTVEALAGMAGAFARGGGDLVKDDHNLVDNGVDAFVERVSRCHEAVQTANAESGGRTLYLPNLLLPVSELERAVVALARLGIAGVLVSPMLVGLDITRHLASTYRLLVMAHPAFAGTFFHDRRHGITPGVLLGTLFRLAGADIAVFPNAGGRFAFTEDECRDLQQRLQRPLGTLAPALPAPAGGMQFDNLDDMAAMYGADCVFLVGGGLLDYSPDLARSTAAFREKIAARFPATSTQATGTIASACEITPAPAALQNRLQTLLRFRDDFTWEGRPASVYKTSGKLPFKEVSRTELIGGRGERTSFDLRYFEIAPGGFSSREKHAHTHVIICLRGHGVLEAGGERLALAPNDIAYVAPLQVHQLRNQGDEPFGFLCLVDHERDRPLAP